VILTRVALLVVAGTIGSSPFSARSSSFGDGPALEFEQLLKTTFADR